MEFTTFVLPNNLTDPHLEGFSSDILYIQISMVDLFCIEYTDFVNYPAHYFKVILVIGSVDYRYIQNF